MRKTANKVLAAPSIKASWYYAASGACFAVATLFMARVMTPIDFGVVALAIAISNVGISAAPAGMSGVRLRHDIRTDSALLTYALVIIGTVGVGLGLFGWRTYALEPVVVIAIVAAIFGGGMAVLGLIPLSEGASILDLGAIRASWQPGAAAECRRDARLARNSGLVATEHVRRAGLWRGCTLGLARPMAAARVGSVVRP